MVNVPVWTVERPVNYIDYIAALQDCKSVREVGEFGEQVPMPIREDVRFTKAVADKLKAIAEARSHLRRVA